MLGRVNSLASEPADAPQSRTRLFVIDQNGGLYILDKKATNLTTYIDFSKVFGKFAAAASFGGYSTGFYTIAFDPAYSRNGKFYSVHTEQPRYEGTALPPGFTPTPSLNPPAGEVSYQSVLTEWTDSNIQNVTFEGTAREVLRVGFNFTFHPMGDLLFNPLARSGDADYGNLYIGVGDGTAGERAGVTHTIPQRLDAVQGKILRITPDITLRPSDLLSSNGRYRIPSTGSNANPFISISGARGEIYAYGFRNPHRLTWDSISNTLIANDIGAGSWEEVNIVNKGGNYGWAEREGPEQLFIGSPNGVGSRINPPIPFPSPDAIVVEDLEKPVTPVYPAAAYSHRDGSSIGSGFVYRGKLMPNLVGKYVFTDIVTGRLFYVDLAEMLATRGMPDKLAALHELQVVFKSSKTRIFDVVAEAYRQRRVRELPNANVLPGNSGLTGAPDPYGVPYGGGRADVRLGMDGDGEIYVLSKTDGMIRRLTSVQQ
jgi:hypothetical protein